MIFRRLTAEAIGLTAASAHSSSNSNRAFWDRKRETNMARDRRVTRTWQLPSAVYPVLLY